MKRRVFPQATLAIGTLLAFPALSQTTAKRLVAGRDYQVVDPRAPVDAPQGKIEVVEFFWYSCPHCNAFEPLLDKWLRQLPKDVAFRRVPVAFRDDFVPQQRLYYALEAMGLVNKLHAKVFQAIHGGGGHSTMGQPQPQRLRTLAQIAPWVASQGVNEAKFVEHYNSFSVSTKANRAVQLQDAYRIEGVPALGVAGRFFTDGAMAPSNVQTPQGRQTPTMHGALRVVDALVAEVRAGR